MERNVDISMRMGRKEMKRRELCEMDSGKDEKRISLWVSIAVVGEVDCKSTQVPTQEKKGLGAIAFSILPIHLLSFFLSFLMFISMDKMM